MEIIGKKTGSLFAAACRMGGLLGRGRPEQLHALGRFGFQFGLAYQILDDLRDYRSEPSRMGKEPGRDLAEGKVTLPLLHAYRRADRDGQRLLERLFSPAHRRGQLERIRTRLEELGGFSHALYQARQSVERALSALDALPEGKARSGLAHIALHLVGKECE